MEDIHKFSIQYYKADYDNKTRIEDETFIQKKIY